MSVVDRGASVVHITSVAPLARLGLRRSLTPAETSLEDTATFMDTASLPDLEPKGDVGGHFQPTRCA